MRVRLLKLPELALIDVSDITVLNSFDQQNESVSLLVPVLAHTRPPIAAVLAGSASKVRRKSR